MSSMADFLGALGGGPGAGPAGPPPDDAGAPPEEDNAGGGELFSNSLEALDVAEEALHSFIRLDPDDIDRSQAAKALQIVVGLKAANQKSAQAGDMKHLSRALSAGGVQGG